MDDALRQRLAEKRSQIRARCELLLRIERVATPLGHPDTLVHLFDHTFDEILRSLRQGVEGSLEPRPEPACESNPLRAYFPALEQALLEALIMDQAVNAAVSSEEHRANAHELTVLLRRIAKREMVLYDGICQQRQSGNP